MATPTGPPAWFIEPPVINQVGALDTVVEATTQKQFDQYVSDGYQGPYASQAEAQAAMPSASTQDPTGAGIPNPFSGIQNAIGAVAGAIKGVWDNLSDWRMWASLGWLVLGVFLLLLGIGLWIGKEAVRAVGPALPVVGRFL